MIIMEMAQEISTTTRNVTIAKCIYGNGTTWNPLVKWTTPTWLRISCYSRNIFTCTWTLTFRRIASIFRIVWVILFSSSPSSMFVSYWRSWNIHNILSTCHFILKRFWYRFQAKEHSNVCLFKWRCWFLVWLFNKRWQWLLSLSGIWFYRKNLLLFINLCWIYTLCFIQIIAISLIFCCMLHFLCMWTQTFKDLWISKQIIIWWHIKTFCWDKGWHCHTSVSCYILQTILKIYSLHTFRSNQWFLDIKLLHFSTIMTPLGIVTLQSIVGFLMMSFFLSRRNREIQFIIAIICL